jgi:mevalonate kinase
LGSSAAYSIAVSGALYLGIQLLIGNLPNLELPSTKQKIRDYADVMERMIHTNPSGVDVAISLNGGMLSFIKGATPAENTINLIESSKKMSYEMILVNTNKPRNSKSTIEAVMRLRDNNYDKFKTLMDEIGATTEEILAIHTGKQP